jgi:hypothetical protein
VPAEILRAPNAICIQGVFGVSHASFSHQHPEEAQRDSVTFFSCCQQNLEFEVANNTLSLLACQQLGATGRSSSRDDTAKQMT